MNSVKPKEEPTISQPIYQNENEEEDLFEDIVTDDEQIEENQEVELEQPKEEEDLKNKAEQEVKEQEATVVKEEEEDLKNNKKK